jgi:hypothetical protein
VPADRLPSAADHPPPGCTPVGEADPRAARVHRAAMSTPYTPYVWQPIRAAKLSWLESGERRGIAGQIEVELGGRSPRLD